MDAVSSDVVSESVAKILRCGPSGIDEAIMRLGGQIVKVLEPEMQTTISPRYRLPEACDWPDNVEIHIRGADAGSVVWGDRDTRIYLAGSTWADTAMTTIDNHSTLSLAKYYDGSVAITGWIVIGMTGRWNLFTLSPPPSE